MDRQIMKQLQKDTTTPEQSQRLLELGVPKWTANYKHPLIPCSDGSMVLDMDNVVSCKELCDGEIPLWSAGRLMEIYEMCTGETFERNDVYDIFSDIFTTIESELLNHKIDFSKLEE